MNQNSLEFLNFTNILENFKENIIEIRSKLIQNYCNIDTHVHKDVVPYNLCWNDVDFGIILLIQS